MRADGSDRAIDDQDVALRQVPDCAIHADDDGTANQDARGNGGQGRQRLAGLIRHIDFFLGV
jgi:hypothetical protein